MPTLTEKYVAGYIFNADGDPEVGSNITAAISNRIIRTGADNLVIEDDETVTATTDGTGRFVIQLHPNNQPGDSPLNTHWTIVEPSGHTEAIFIPYNHSLGGTDSTAIPYTSLIVDPADLDSPQTDSTLSDRLTRVESAITALATMNQAGLSALSPPVSTALVDAAESTATLATSSQSGLLSSTLFNVIDTLRSGQANDVSNMVKKDANGIILPQNADPTTTGFTVRLYQSTADGAANIQLGNVNGRTRLAPALASPSWLATADLTISGTSYADVATFDVVANATYHITGPIHYSAETSPDLMLRFTNIPTGATLRWGKVAIAAADAGTDGIGEPDLKIATGNGPLTLGGNGALQPILATMNGVLKTGSTAGTVTLQAQKSTTGTNCAIFAASALFFVRYA
jgi:hypothetical protein